MSNEINRIGFIGLGSMGGAQARELAKLAIPLTVYDVSDAAMRAFEGRAELAGSIGDLGKVSDVVGICVQDDAQVNDCIDQLLPTMKPGSTILVHSTISPATSKSVAAKAEARGIKLLEASVTRTEMTQDGPFVFCMIGGDEAEMARVQPVLDAYSTNTMHVGPLGSAMALKISNNLVSWCEIMLGLECQKLATAAGVPIEKLLTVMNRNGVMSPPMAGFMAFARNPGDEKSRGLMAVQAGIGEKDLSLAERLASDAGVDAPITSYVRSLVKRTVLDVCES
jgi:3-hydroxyisobutyrate dehydrogenase